MGGNEGEEEGGTESHADARAAMLAVSFLDLLLYPPLSLVSSVHSVYMPCMAPSACP